MKYLLTITLCLFFNSLNAQLFTHIDTVGIEINGDKVVSTAATAWDNSGGNSLETLGKNGYVSGIPSYGKHLKFGLSDVTGGHNWNEYSYCFYIQPNGVLDLYNKTTRILRTSHISGDVLKIEKNGNSIIFHKNNLSIGRVDNIAETNLHVDYSFFDQYSEITFTDFASDSGSVDNTNPWISEGNIIYTNNIENNVGIGTLSPGLWKLAVNGKIRAKEVKVETGWSDFVFASDYKLPTLKEVENHINKHGHLKDIPSAKEVEKNGIFLGEMDSKLLQKIEELTLYIIQQQKEIENLKKENSEVKSLYKKVYELQLKIKKMRTLK